MYFENALKDVRQERDKAKPPAQLDHDYSLPKPDEAFYADDTDFITEGKNESTWFQENITTILQSKPGQDRDHSDQTKK